MLPGSKGHEYILKHVEHYGFLVGFFTAIPQCDVSEVEQMHRSFPSN